MTLCAPGAVAATKEVVMNTVPRSGFCRVTVMWSYPGTQEDDLHFSWFFHIYVIYVYPLVNRKHADLAIESGVANANRYLTIITGV